MDEFWQVDILVEILHYEYKRFAKKYQDWANATKKMQIYHGTKIIS